MEAELKLKNIDEYLETLRTLKEEIIDTMDCIDELEKRISNTNNNFKIIIKINDKCKTPLELTNCIKEQLVQYLKKISCN